MKLKGYGNEPVFASLSALVYQHTITALALPARLVLPQSDLVVAAHNSTAPDGTDAASTSQGNVQLAMFPALAFGTPIPAHDHSAGIVSISNQILAS